MAQSYFPVGATLITVPDMMSMAKLGEFPVTSKTMIRMIDRIVECGFTSIEILMDIINWHPEVFDHTVINHLRQVHDEKGIRLTGHLPFHNLNTTTHVEEVRKGSVKNILRAIRHVDSLPMENFVLHLTGAVRQGFMKNEDLPSEVTEFMANDVISQGNRTIEELLEGVEKQRLLVENLPSLSIEFPKIWARQWELGICLDIGHVLLRQNDLHQTIDEVKSEFPIREFHVHDVVEDEKKKRKDHRPLGTGLIDFGKLARQIYADAPAPVVILEAQWDFSKQSLPIWLDKISAIDD